jgi:hypothetical protein
MGFVLMEDKFPFDVSQMKEESTPSVEKFGMKYSKELCNLIVRMLDLVFYFYFFTLFYLFMVFILLYPSLGSIEATDCVRDSYNTTDFVCDLLGKEMSEM